MHSRDSTRRFENRAGLTSPHPVCVSMSQVAEEVRLRTYCRERTPHRSLGVESRHRAAVQAMCPGCHNHMGALQAGVPKTRSPVNKQRLRLPARCVSLPPLPGATTCTQRPFRPCRLDTTELAPDTYLRWSARI